MGVAACGPGDFFIEGKNPWQSRCPPAAVLPAIFCCILRRLY
jgi:hypothetical protein